MSPRERASYSNLMSLMSLVIGDSNFRDNTKKRKKPFAAGRFPISRSETVLLAGRIITIVNIIILLLLLLLPRVPPHHSFRFIFFSVPRSSKSSTILLATQMHRLVLDNNTEEKGEQLTRDHDARILLQDLEVDHVSLPFFILVH